MRRIDNITETSNRNNYYSDFLMNFDKNPLSKELARVNDERAIVRSIKNLINTSRGERLYQPSIGCNLKKMLFEPIDDISTDIIRTEIMTTIQQHEPRVILQNLSVVPDEENNAYNVGVTFSMVNAPSNVFSFSTVLKRVR